MADLQADDRGVATPRPPLRATPRDIRATRADADAVAVKMAKAWIETIEREGTLGAPALREEPSRVDAALAAGAERCRTLARETMRSVRQRMGFD